MGIKLDWEVESEGGWSEVGEDPKAVEARRRRARRIRNAVLVLLAILLIVAAIVGYRLFTVGQQVREALKATVAAETLALRIGDREAYLMAQSEVGGWRQIQEQTFEQYQEEGERTDTSGQIVAMDISADRARVTVREVVDGQPYSVMWFYQRDPGGWKHVAPDPRFWGDEKERHTRYFDFNYYSEDQVLVDELVDHLDSWWKTACDLAQCNPTTMSLDIRIEPDRLAKADWAPYDSSVLIIPSPLLGRFPADGKPDPLLVGRLADLIAARWAEYLVGKDVRAYSEEDWLRSEIHWWLRNSFDPTLPSAPLITPLVQAHGKGIVLLLVNRIKRGDPAVPVLEELTGSRAVDLRVGWELYLTTLLRAEMALLQEDKVTEAMLLYADPERPVADAAVTSSVGKSNIDTIQVVGSRRYGDLVWGETVFNGVAPTWYSRIVPVDDTMTIFLPFRLLEDRQRWVHSVATSADWGTAREDRGAHVIVRYHDLDAPTVAGLQAALEQTYSQVEADVGRLADIPVLVEILAFDFEGNVLPFQGPGLGQEQPNSLNVIPLQLPSPYSRHYEANGNTREVLQSVAVYALIETLVAQPVPGDYPLTFALQQEELGRFGFAPDDIPDEAVVGDSVLESGSGRSILRQPPESLETLWPPDAIYATRDYIAAEVLIELLVELYGEDVLARLVPNISQAVSMDDWLYISLGIHAVDIEPEWRERVEAALSASP